MKKLKPTIIWLQEREKTDYPKQSRELIIKLSRAKNQQQDVGEGLDNMQDLKELLK